MEKINFVPCRRGDSPVDGGSGRGEPGVLPWIRHCLPTRATLGEPSFHIISYKTWRIVYMRSKKLACVEG